MKLEYFVNKNTIAKSFLQPTETPEIEHGVI